MEELEKELLETNSNMERLQRSYAELVELQLVLEKAGVFFDSRSGQRFEVVPEVFSGYADGESPLLEAVVSGHSWWRLLCGLELCIGYRR